MTAEESERILNKASAELGEHYDAVQILVTWNEEGLTKSGALGCGNWYARQGMAHEFITKDVAQENARQISEAITPPDEGSEWKDKNPS
jgi:hypothetical protein